MNSNKNQDEPGEMNQNVEEKKEDVSNNDSKSIQEEIKNDINQNNLELEKEEEMLSEDSINDKETILKNDQISNFFKNIIDSEMDLYHSKMWNDDIKNAFIKFINNNQHIKIYFYIKNNENSLYHSYNRPFLEVENYEIILFIKMKNNLNDINFNYLNDFIQYRVINQSNSLDNILHEMNIKILPNFFKNTSWPDNIKKEFLSQTHKFLSFVTEKIGQREKKKNLYIPKEIYSDNMSQQDKKDQIHRLESIVNQWIKQIKDILNSHSSQNESENDGALEEIKYCSDRKNDLLHIKNQLDNKEIQNIISILRNIKSLYIENIDSLLKSINLGAEEASNNLKFLKVLEEPCKKMDVLNPEQIPEILPSIMCYIRLIWENSSYYNVDEKIASLLRKISNQIIKRCCKLINIDDMLGGNIEKCKNDLDNAKFCGNKWKDIYNQHYKILKQKNNCWNFNGESIFAQIDAFIQRCNDLKEICDGQIQFARKGKNEHLPFFSGSKGPEIISVLDEIKDTFQKYLEKIKNTEKTNILDIKSTKWQDNYNNFKLGMRNLDNMYVNLINFSFEKINTIDLSIEYLQAFYSLAIRTSIKNHVKKKIEKVNEIVMRELKIAEDFAKKKIDLHINHGEYSGKVLWIKYLLLRLEKMKKLYDNLIFIDSIYKDRIEEEYNKIELTLRTLMFEYQSEYKKRIPEDEDFIKYKLDYKVFNESNVKNYQEYIKKSKNDLLNKSLIEGHIECNFDKDLLEMMIELFNFKKLVKDGISINNEKFDELINLQKDSLRVYRESVMLSVRDYNKILDLMDHSEKLLFKEHLKIITDILSRGIKNLSWGAKNLLDNYINECRSKCSFVFKILMEFKKSKKEIENKCKEISENIKFIDYDNRKVYELEEFSQKQAETIKKASGKWIVIFDIIKDILFKMYDHFEDKSVTVQKEWFNHIKNIDNMIQKEINKSMKKSFQELLRTIAGDKKSKTNPTQILKIYIILKEEPGSLSYPAFEPNDRSINQEINNINTKCFQILKEFKKFQIIMLNERNKRIKNFLIKQNELKKKPINSKNMKQIDTNIKDDDLVSKDLISFKDNAVSENTSLVSQINSALTNQMTERNRDSKENKNIINDMLDQWKKTLESKRNTLLQDNYDKIFFQNEIRGAGFKKKMGDDIDNFRAFIEEYEKFQNDITNNPNKGVEFCFKVDNSKITQRLTDIVYEKQKKFLSKIKEHALKELNELYKKFKNSEEELRVKPMNLVKLDSAMQLHSKLMKEKPLIESQLIPLEEKFKLLDDYIIGFTEKETKMRIEKEKTFDNFCLMLEDIEERNNLVYKHFNTVHKMQIYDFYKEVKEKKEDFTKNSPKGNIEGGYKRAFQIINNYEELIVEYRKKEESLKFGINLFNIEYENLKELEEISEQLKSLNDIWNVRKLWEEELNDLKPIPFLDIKCDEIKEFCNKYKEKILDFTSEIKNWECTQILLQNIEDFKQLVPIIQILRANCLREWHWNIIKNLVKDNFNHKSEFFNLDKIIKLKFDKVIEGINEQYEIAINEFKIEQIIKEIKTKWSKEDLQLETKTNTNFFTISNKYYDKLNEILESDIVQLSCLKTNAYVDVFKNEIEKWDHDLNLILETLDILILVQKKFIYFNNIFNNIQEELSQLSGDTNSFLKVRTKFVSNMNQMNKEKNVKRCLTQPNLKKLFFNLSNDLDIIQKYMKSFLEKRRSEFPRFYFLSDEDMFEILGKSKDPYIINKNMKKMFEGIKYLKCIETHHGRNANKNQFFNKMVSSDGEEVELLNEIEINGEIINMMSKIEKEMKDKLKILIPRVFKLDHNENNKIIEPIKENLKDCPGQILILGCQIEWTERCKKAIDRQLGNQENKDNKEKDNKRRNEKKEEWGNQKSLYNHKLDQLTNMIRNTNFDLDKIKLIAIIIIEVHNRDIMDNLSIYCNSSNSFEWKKQLRYYNPENNMIINIEQGNARFPYGFEYQGNNGRLVVTPLTDRCYLTLTTAMNLRKGGNLQGPAGTGKTETVKDLGKNLGRFVFVFNCSEGLDVNSLREMFGGFARTGFWGCFDEFNRIEIEVLSVIAIQINCILEALSMDVDTFMFEGNEIGLNKNAAIFITMNPDYSGRTELPDNLKALFRPISMIVPDSEQICRISLQAEGFTTSDILSKKIVSLYNLMNQQLSKQHHYDFGLRAIKSVLNAAGLSRKKEYIKVDKKENDFEKEFEIKIIIQSILEMNEPKLVTEDIDPFYVLMKNLFKDEKIVKKINNSMDFVIPRIFDKMNLDNTEYFYNKVIQLYNSKITRHGNMIVGDSMSGKSTILDALVNVLDDLSEKDTLGLYHKVKIYKLNPKSISINELYGFYDSEKDESIVGVFSHLMDLLCNKEISNENDEVKYEKWVILDGPIDTKWIESMNSLLDDNKVLTLLDGNRINLHPSVHLFFEVEELTQASPATVSRCGMVYIDKQELNWTSLRYKWILEKHAEGVSNETLDFVEDLFDKWLNPVLEKKKALNDVIKIEETSLIRNMCKFIDIFCANPNNGISLFSQKKDDIFWMKFERFLLFSLIWSIGSLLDTKSRKQFDNLIRDIEGIFPFSQTIYDYYFNLEKSEFSLWEDKLTINPSNWKPPKDTIFNKFLVETTDTAKIRYLYTLLMPYNIPLLAIGDTGTGKSILMNSILNQLDENTYSYNIINLSGQTTSIKLQEIIESKLNRINKKKFIPFNGKKAIIYIDDLNMPKPDEFGYQPPIELLRQFIERESWYDRSSLDILIQIKETQFVSSMGLPGGGRNEITKRLTNKFFIFNFTIPNDIQIKRIFTSILSYKFSDFDSEEIKPQIDNSINFILNLYKSILKDEIFKPIPIKSHYIFNLRDISKIISGLNMIDKYNCDSTKKLMNLLLHECKRVFYDRMINKTDKDKFNEFLNELFEGQFGLPITEITNEIEPLFTNIVDERKAYTFCTDIEWIKSKINYFLKNYNKINTNQINIVLFEQAILYCSKINRIINQSNGHGLLIGEGGSGRHSLSKIAAIINEYSIYQLEISKNFNLNEFKNRIKILFEDIISNNRNYVFIFSDNEIRHKEIIEDINNIMSLGEIPNLYAKKENKDEFENIREILKEKYKVNNEEKIYDIFKSVIQEKLNILFCIQRTGSNLRTLGRQYPSLINNTNQIWFEDWPDKALIEVAKKFTSKIEFENETINNKIPEIFGKIHNDIFNYAEKMKKSLNRIYYVTPKNYIDFIKCFDNLLNTKREELEFLVKKYSVGLEKLEEAKLKVDELKTFMDAKRLEVSRKKKDCEEMMIKINHEHREAEKEKAKIEDKETIIEKERKKTQSLTDEAQEKLDKAIPLLDKANEKIKDLDRTSIAEFITTLKGKDIRAVAVMNAIMVLLDRPIDWDSILKEVTDSSFLKKIRSIDKDNIRDRTIIKLEKYTVTPELHVNLEKFSVVVNLLFNYVTSIEQYAKINRDIEPKRKQVARLKEELEIKEKDLKELKSNLDKILLLVKDLNSKNDELKFQYEDCKKEFNSLENRLDRAEKLVSGLGSSKDSWENKKNKYIDLRKKVDGNVILGSVFLNYFGTFPSEYREEILKENIINYVKQAKINYSRDFKFHNFMEKEVVVLEWNSKGLPSDQFSIENGVISKYSSRYCYLIDPQLQAQFWIKNMNYKNLKIVNPSTENILQKIEKSIEIGEVVLYNNANENVEFELLSLFNKNIKIIKNKKTINFSNKLIPYNENFNLIISTKLENPHIKPELSTLLSVINFGVKEKGLEEQLLAVILSSLDESLEDQRKEFIKLKAKCEDILQGLEDKILSMIQNRNVPLVDDIELIQILQNSKETEEEVKSKIDTNKIALKKILLNRENYRYLGMIGSKLFFAISQLSKINFIYQFSIEWYIKIFKSVIDKNRENKGNVSSTVKDTIEKIDKILRKKIYKQTCYSIFEKDKILLALQITISLAPIDELTKKEQDKKKKYFEEGDFDKQKHNNYYEVYFENEWNYFIKGGASNDGENKPQNPDPSWLTDTMWDHIIELEGLQKFQGILGSFLHNTKEWKKFYSSSFPENNLLPSDWSQNIKGFSLLLILKALRPDRIIFGCKKYIKDTLGEEFIKTPSFDIDKIYKKMTNRTPVLLILAPGFDPWYYLENLAEKNNYKINQISWGQGQLKKAKELWEKQQIEGNWIYLANIHLSQPFLRELEQIIDYIELDKNKNISPNFRLFLSSIPKNYIPLSVLQKCIKVTTEPPTGIKANMIKIFNKLIPEKLPNKEDINEFNKYRKLIFGLSWLHALLIERKRFKNLGWNVLYDFNDSDFLFTEKLLRVFVDKTIEKNSNQTLQWDAIKYIISEVNYGGRITDDWDRRLLVKYTDEIFQEELLNSQGFVLSKYKDDSEYKMLLDNQDDTNLKKKLLNMNENKDRLDDKNEKLSQFKIDSSNYVKSFPDIELPAVFGQHINAEINSQIFDSNNLISSLLALVPKDTHLKNDDNKEEFYSYIERLEILPDRIEYEAIYQRQLKITDNIPLKNFMLQEVKRLNSLLLVIKETLENLKKGIKGEILINEKNEIIMQNIIDNIVPEEWKYLYLSLKPLSSWIKDLENRILQITNWGLKSMPYTFWLGGFTYPTGFTTALKQIASDKTNTAIDSIKWEFFIKEENFQCSTHPKEGSYIKGLYLEGAKLTQKDHKLTDADPMGLYYKMPIVHFKPTNKITKLQKKHYKCPIYIYPKREGTVQNPSYIFTIYLDIVANENGIYDEGFWIKRGTAVLLSLSD